MAPDREIELQWKSSISAVDRQQWDALALPSSTPLFEYEWLSLLESSGSVTPETGWDPRILLAEKNGKLIAACPFYRKTHSEGEFIFDYPWAEIAKRLGIRYFPKLVGMSPLTPVPAFQPLVDEDENPDELLPALCGEIKSYAQTEKLSGVHLQYTDPDWVDRLSSCGFRVWEHACYLWENKGYGCFEDFVVGFSKNQRHNIRREQKKLGARGITVSVVAGDEIPESWSGLMYRYYYQTNFKFGPWACLYLTEAFFRGIFRFFRHRLVIAAGFAHGEKLPVGMAMFLRKGPRLWGRYWGSRSYIPELHFNLCYYAPIRWAIEQGIRFFDPGIGSEHKARRGFESRTGHSLHLFFDPRLRALFEYNIDRFNELVRDQIEEQNRSMPLIRENG